jgi:S-formylglutathione hydrolase FrmB
MPVSLIHGWVPLVVQAVAVVALVFAIGWRSRRWRLLWIPVSVVVGVLVAVAVNWFISYQGLAGTSPPVAWWVWLGLTGLAAAVLVVGWRGAPWWRRGVSVVAVPLSLLCAALALNLWVGYVPTVRSAWDLVTGARLPGQTDQATVEAMRRRGESPTKGTLVTVSIPDDASGFRHRDELVYLPPAWYASNPPPALPVVMMVHGEIGKPSDWVSAGNAVKTVDAFAAAHGGNGPILVFPDSSGQFSNDTECVNGSRGNAADHVVKDVVPYVLSHYGASADPAKWGIVGWSAGGTCAINLTVLHPHLFSAFVDIDGEIGPNAGTKDQTIARLFGGDPAAWARFDPRAVMENHGPYTGVAGVFSVSEATPTVYRDGTPNPGSVPFPDPVVQAGDLAAIANYMCSLASSYGIQCSVVGQRTKHDFPSAAQTFATYLPWLAGRIGTPGVPVTPLPGAPSTP